MKSMRLRQLWKARQVSNGQLGGLTFVFVWFFVGGIMHFVATDIEARIVPPYIPWPVAAVIVSGVFELLGAFGILIPSTRKAAGIGLFLLTLAVTPAHIYMLQRPELFNVPVWALWLRLPIQVALLWLIVWSTQRVRGGSHMPALTTGAGQAPLVETSFTTKYKAIRSMAHNWSHSFMSPINYVDGGFVYEDMYQMARQRRGAKVTISWIPSTNDELSDLPLRVQKCVAAYRTGLAEHLKRHRIHAAALVQFRTEVYVADNFQMHVRAFVLDDKNKEHVAYVWS